MVSVVLEFLFNKEKKVHEAPDVIRPVLCPFIGKECIGAQCDFHPENPKNGHSKSCPITNILEQPYTFKK